jgi:hypothetical protein
MGAPVTGAGRGFGGKVAPLSRPAFRERSDGTGKVKNSRRHLPAIGPGGFFVQGAPSEFQSE